MRIEDFALLFNKIYSFLISPPQDNEIINGIKTIFIFFGCIFFILAVYFIKTTSFLNWLILQDIYEFFNFKPYSSRKLKGQWEKIVFKIKNGVEGEMKLAILEATKLLKESLETMGYPGETLEEKLNQISPDIISNVNELKGAFRVYKNIIEDPAYRLKKETALYIMLSYEKAFKELNLI